ncbi:hypothetical protein [Sharpea azabuensis]|uniref:hypothetical protein n=1 Tax=Sharpea azabuensis TaxID=322505 RepID=UPI001569FCE3|nr:hypothetical protein [Sharpea azabuensis]
MEKTQGKAKVLSISAEPLQDYNEENDTQRVVMSFQYVTEGAEDNDLQALIEGLSHNTTRTVILDLASLEGENLKKKIASLKSKLEGNTIVCTTYVASISELNDEGHASVKTDERTYASLNRSYVGKFDDENAVLQSLKDRLQRSIDNADFEWA